MEHSIKPIHELGNKYVCIHETEILFSENQVDEFLVELGFIQ